MSTHSVEQHLHVGAEEYDRAIRTFVPHYDEMLTTGVALVGALAPRRAHLIDLGGGTGALGQALLAGLPEVTVTVLDIDARMLAQARTRLAGFAGRVSFLEASFHDPLPRCDAVVASLALHHVSDLEAKTRVYAGIHASLAPGGLLLALDAVVSRDPRLAAHTFDGWAASMAEHGIEDAAARRHFADWAQEDTYFSLHQELNALARAGFARPECFWRRGSQAIFGGLR